MAQHYDLGKKGEQLAVDHLLSQGYEILARNYRYEKAEVDILAKKDDILAAVEVKTRSTDDFGDPQDFVKPKQVQRLVKAVDAFIQDHSIDLEVRFDIVAIVLNNSQKRIEHLTDAFYHF